MNITELQTPCLLLDIDKLKANIARMHTHVHALGGVLRPHVKTSKSANVVNLLFTPEQDRKLTVSTLSEMTYFIENGFSDIMYAVGITPQKLPKIIQCMKSGANISIILDDITMARTLEQIGKKNSVVFNVFIELDVDGHRSGVEVNDPALLNIAHCLHDGENTRLMGVMTHAGESYNCASQQAIINMAEQERSRSVHAAHYIRADGIPCPHVSIGSSPTAYFGQDLTGITEVRAGVYMFQDLFQAGLGCCSHTDIALSVLTTINAHKPNKNLLITDAGWMAMSRDRGTASQTIDQGYGMVLTLDGHPIDDLIVSAANQEHGIITNRTGTPIDFSNFPIGTQIRILPNHACSTAAQYDNYQVHSDRELIAQWSRIRGW